MCFDNYRVYIIVWKLYKITKASAGLKRIMLCTKRVFPSNTDRSEPNFDPEKHKYLLNSYDSTKTSTCYLSGLLIFKELHDVSVCNAWYPEAVFDIACYYREFYAHGIKEDHIFMEFVSISDHTIKYHWECFSHRSLDDTIDWHFL